MRKNLRPPLYDHSSLAIEYFYAIPYASHTFACRNQTDFLPPTKHYDTMIIGVPKEIKTNENRIAVTPAGVMELVKHGHTVYVQKSGGLGSGYSDQMYIDAGAEVLPSIEDVYQKAEMIIKVKEPIEQEYPLIKSHHLLFTYFHFASYEPLTRAMIESGATCLAYETVMTPDRKLPLLVPMSEVAGRMAIQQGAKYLESPMEGKGVLLGGVPGVKRGKVIILGGGVVGIQAAKMAAGLGADVTIFDINLDRLRYLADVMPANVTTEYSNEYNIRAAIKEADLIVGAVLIPGAKAPSLITREMLKDMEAGTVLVDVAVDQGGCIETCRPTTHKDPIFIVDDIVHYCVANMPGAVPRTSTIALTNATLPYAIELANNGWKKAIARRPELKPGLNIINGKIVYENVAKAFNLDYHPIDTIL